MKYTIIDSKKGTGFIQQNYDTRKEANERLQTLGDKFKHRLILDEKSEDCLRLAVVGVDDEGAFHELTEEGETKTA